jgi:hypothetical protein
MLVLDLQSVQRRVAGFMVSKAVHVAGPGPSVFGRNLQTLTLTLTLSTGKGGERPRGMPNWSHACKSFKRRSKGVNPNGILE